MQISRCLGNESRSMFSLEMAATCEKQRGIREKQKHYTVIMLSSQRQEDDAGCCLDEVVDFFFPI